jgi:hypothetical protein
MSESLKLRAEAKAAAFTAAGYVVGDIVHETGRSFFKSVDIHGNERVHAYTDGGAEVLAKETPVEVAVEPVEVAEKKKPKPARKPKK